MADKDSLKRLWKEYAKLKNWALSTNPREFTVETSSLDDNETLSSSAIDTDEGDADAQSKFISIVGLIYPSTEPFLDWALRIEIRLPYLYPHKGPELYMKTSIRHPNIDKNGE